MFSGIKASEGEGLVVEVHIDLITPRTRLVSVLEGLGFEDDPFEVFHPQGYTNHMTGRVKVTQQELKVRLREVREVVEGLLVEGRGERGFYVETELVRGKHYFNTNSVTMGANQLSGFLFSGIGRFGGAKADIHVEFPAGNVSPEVRRYLTEQKFYWVKTPKTPYFGSEEIATLQTLTFNSAKQIYSVLCESPLPGCTGVHLEQKLSMVASHPGLPMPEVISVKRV
jgi:hypothetical protein